MPELQTAVQGLQSGADVLFLLVGAILVFAMHGGFAFLEAGTVRHKNQVNALCKILVDFAISTVAYFFVGYTIAYGVAFFVSAPGLSGGACRLRSAGPDARQVLLPVHLRGGRPGHHLRRHRRARALPAAVRGDRAHRRPVLSLLRGHRLEQELRPAGEVLQGAARRGVPRLRRLHRRARGGRLARLLRRAPAGPAARPLRQGPHDRHSALVDSLARHGLVAAVHRLVRLQRDERAVAADGHRASSPSTR